MKTMYLVLIFSIFCVSLQKAENLEIGNAAGGNLIYQETVKLDGIPFKSRVGKVFFGRPNNRNIRAVSAIDLDKSNAAATATAGGVGSTFVNIILKSEKGERLNYQAVSAIDLNKSKGKATVTAGGVGSTFVNIKIKSERGEGLNYQVQIFV